MQTVDRVAARLDQRVATDQGAGWRSRPQLLLAELNDGLFVGLVLDERPRVGLEQLAGGLVGTFEGSGTIKLLLSIKVVEDLTQAQNLDEIGRPVDSQLILGGDQQSAGNAHDRVDLGELARGQPFRLEHFHLLLAQRSIGSVQPENHQGVS